jgi:hypothetical protein
MIGYKFQVIIKKHSNNNLQNVCFSFLGGAFFLYLNAGINTRQLEKIPVAMVKENENAVDYFHCRSYSAT